MSNTFFAAPVFPETDAPYWGASPAPDGAWHFALWAPDARQVMLTLDGKTTALMRDVRGVFNGRAPARAGMSYSFVVDGRRIADPASRQQVRGVTGASRLVDPAVLRRNRHPWMGRPFDEAVISELHIGSFTPEGSFAAAGGSDRLEALARMGVSAIELMPLGQFPGRQGWGYDSVLPFAPHTVYGGPEDLCALIDRAHGLGMAIYLDVVFNHFGPLGCELPVFCPSFFHEKDNEWGKAIDYSQPAVRAYFTQGALGWLRDYGFDGLRLDAIDQIQDDSDPEFLVDLARDLRAALPDRPVHLMTEDKRNITRLHLPGTGLYDGEWNDDYHHALHVLATGETTHHYAEFAATPLEDLCLSLRSGFVLQGQPRPAGQEVKGEPSGHMPWCSFINFNQNHDQVGNRAQGRRLVSLIGHEKALVAHALLLTAPFTPLLFMGEEVGSEVPFPWFADYAGDLARKMRAARCDEYADVPGFAARMADPMDPETWRASHPYGQLPLEAPSWAAETERLLTLRREVLLKIYRSGPVAEATADPLGRAAAMVAWPCVLGTVRVAFCLDGPSWFALPAGAELRYGTHAPCEGRPWFQLWLEERAGTEQMQGNISRAAGLC